MGNMDTLKQAGYSFCLCCLFPFRHIHMATHET